MTELAKHSFSQAEAWQSLLGTFTRDTKILYDDELVTDLGNEVKPEWGGSVAHRLLVTEWKAQWSVKASAASVMYERTLHNMASYDMEWAIAICQQPKINCVGLQNILRVGFGAKNIWFHHWCSILMPPKWHSVIKYQVHSEIRNFKLFEIFLLED